MNTRTVPFTAIATTILVLVCITGSHAGFISPYVGFGMNPLTSPMYGYGVGNAFGHGFGKNYGLGLGMGGFAKYPYYGMGYPFYPYYGLGGMGGLGGLMGGYGGFGGMGYGGMMGGYGMGGMGMGGMGLGGLGMGLLKKEMEAEGEYYKRMAQDEAELLNKKYASTSGKYVVPGTLGTVNAAA